MGRVITTGGTGMIGTALMTALARHGHEVVLLSRNPAKAGPLLGGARAILWDGKTAQGWGDTVDGADAVVNLAGATIGRPPWTASYKRLIRESRVNAGRAVLEAVTAARQKPAVVVQSSGIGYYGLHGDELLDEDAPAGGDFLARVCVDWEKSTAAVKEMGVRQVVVRSALVLSAHGGVLPLIALPFRFFVGGPIGSGRQYWSWIHIADEVAAMQFLMENESAIGPFNLSSPHPETNRDFSRLLGRALHRPSRLPVPGLALKLALGEMAELSLLGGQRVIPKRLQALGYQFRFPDTEPALRDLLH
jgi:uncharacterized protein (TIGR01777 family)